MDFGSRHWLHALSAYALFMAAWVPYRWICGGLDPAEVYLIDLAAKPAITALALYPTLVLADRGGLRDLGLSPAGMPRRYAAGLVGAAAMWAAHYLLIPTLLGYPPGPPTPDLDLESALLSLDIILTAGPMEELFDRGYVFPEMLRSARPGRIGTLAAASAASALFALSHLPIDLFVWRAGPLWTAFHMASTFAFGAALCWLSLKTGGIEAAVGFHTGWDLAVTILVVPSVVPGWAYPIREAVGLTLGVAAAAALSGARGGWPRAPSRVRSSPQGT